MADARHSHGVTVPRIDFNSFDYLSDSVVITDGRLDPPGPRILHVNQAFTRMTGYDVDEVIGKTPRILQGPKTHRGMLDRLRHRLSRGEDVVVEAVNYRKDGSEFGVEWRVQPVRDRAGQITNFLSIQRDVTDRMLAQSNLSEHKSRLVATLDAIGNGLLLADRRGRVTHLNPPAASLTGWTSEQAAGRHLAEILSLARSSDEQPLPDLAQPCLDDCRTVEPRDPCLLTPRRGTPILVQVGAAPVCRQPGQVDGITVWLRRLDSALPLTPAAPAGSAEQPRSLVNGAELQRRLQRILESAQELGSVHAVAFLELRGIASETIPEATGLQRRIVAALSRKIRQSDTLAEIDDARFGLILHHCPLQKAVGVARTLLTTLRTIASREDGDASPEPSFRAVVGLVPFSAETPTTQQLLDRGAQACEEAWALGGDRVQVFRSAANDRARREHELLRAVELLQAIEQNQLCLFGQEIVPLKPDLRRYVEVLVRMPDGDGGFIPPAAFVRAAERYDLATRLDRWVVTTALASYRRLFGNTGTGITINLSGKSVGDADLLDLVRCRLPEYDVPPDRVCFEITETAAINDIEIARDFIDALRQLGCRFALDDFGSGHASFRYLKALEVDYLKIDRSFVRDVLERDFDLAMVEAILGIGRVLDIRVVAEGVESQAIRQRLRDVGLDYAQGFVHGKPCPLEELARPIAV
ncbi:MAG: EAL domain-containing protein [Acidobacteriota bacterium]